MKEVNNSIAEFDRHKQEYDEERVKEQVRNKIIQSCFLSQNQSVIISVDILFVPLKQWAGTRIAGRSKSAGVAEGTCRNSVQNSIGKRKSSRQGNKH